jgi:hypothetical protein
MPEKKKGSPEIKYSNSGALRVSAAEILRSEKGQREISKAAAFASQVLRVKPKQ